jgi:hypothetical protein
MHNKRNPNPLFPQSGKSLGFVASGRRCEIMDELSQQLQHSGFPQEVADEYAQEMLDSTPAPNPEAIFHGWKSGDRSFEVEIIEKLDSEKV